MGRRCPSFDVLSAYRDGETGAAETALVARHLPGCAECQAALAGFDRLAAALQSTPLVSCAAARPLLSAELDREAGPAEQAVAARHASGCADCAGAVAGWRRLDAALAALPEAFPSPAADARIRALAHRRRAALPTFRGALGGLAAAVALVAVVVAGALSGGAGPRLAAGPNGGQTIVASVAQQVYNPATGFLYVLRPAPTAAVVVRDVGRQVDLKTIALGGQPAFMALSRDAKALYVVDPVARQYVDIDTDRNEIRDRVPMNVSGTPTSIAVDAQTGNIVVATRQSSPAPAGSAAPAPRTEIAVIDPASKRLQTVKTIEVAATRIVVDAAAGRLFLLGPTSVSVVDANTYKEIDSIPRGAVSVAASATGGASAILSERGGDAVLSFYRGAGEATFAGTPVNVFALADGGFAVVVDDPAGGGITLVDPDGDARGPAFALSGGAAQLSFDPSSGRFIAASGATVATVSGALISAAATPVPTEAPVSAPPSTPPSAPATASPSAAPATASPPASGPLVVLPTPAPSLFPGAVLSAVGLYRFDVPTGIATVAMTTDPAGQVWAAGADGTIRTIDPSTGAIATVIRLGSVDLKLLTVTGDRVFALDRTGRLLVYDLLARRLNGAVVPFGRTVASMSTAPDGRLWLVASEYAGLLAYDPRTTQFSIVYLEPSARPGSVSVDLAGRVWFFDSTRGALASYEPSTQQLSYLDLASDERVVALAADARAGVWLGTDAGHIYRVSRGSLELVRRVDGSATQQGRIVGFVPSASGGVVVLIDAGESTLVGPPGSRLTVTSGAAASITADGYGRTWVADPTRPVLYIAEGAR